MTVATEGNDLLTSSRSLEPQVAFPEDAGFPELPNLFDAEWVWQTYNHEFGGGETEPARIRIRQFVHRPGVIAMVGYEAEWQPDEYMPSEFFAVKLEQGKPLEVFRYPDDPRLPGLSEAALPETALGLLNRYVLAVPVKRANVEMIRYRPTNRAVLRNSVGRLTFYARVMRPDSAAPLLRAQEVIARSDFVVPRLAGYWADGGVAWFSAIPGENLRRHIRRGNTPDPMPLLHGLETIWSQPNQAEELKPFNLAGAYERAKRIFSHNVGDNSDALRSLDAATVSLDPFVRQWRPTVVAQNDFYDDQMLVLPDGRVALVDFEEAGPGDPMLDAGNFLAHLRWASCFGSDRRKDASSAYYNIFKQAALARFSWSATDLALREAVCLFRTCTNVVRHPQQDWRTRLETGLALVNQALSL